MIIYWGPQASYNKFVVNPQIISACMYNLVNNQKLHSQKGTIKFSLTKLVFLETNNYLTNESNLNTTYLSSLQLATAKGHTDLQL